MEKPGEEHFNLAPIAAGTTVDLFIACSVFDRSACDEPLGSIERGLQAWNDLFDQILMSPPFVGSGLGDGMAGKWEHPIERTIPLEFKRAA